MADFRDFIVAPARSGGSRIHSGLMLGPTIARGGGGDPGVDAGDDGVPKGGDADPGDGDPMEFHAAFNNMLQQDGLPPVSQNTRFPPADFVTELQQAFQQRAFTGQRSSGFSAIPSSARGDASQLLDECGRIAFAIRPYLGAVRFRAVEARMTLLRRNLEMWFETGEGGGGSGFYSLGGRGHGAVVFANVYPDLYVDCVKKAMAAHAECLTNFSISHCADQLSGALAYCIKQFIPGRAPTSDELTLILVLTLIAIALFLAGSKLLALKGALALLLLLVMAGFAGADDLIEAIVEAVSGEDDEDEPGPQPGPEPYRSPFAPPSSGVKRLTEPKE